MAARTTKLLHLKSFTLSWAGGEGGRKRDPCGASQACMRQEGREPTFPSGWCQSAPHHSWTHRQDPRTAHQTDKPELGRAGGRVLGSGGGLCLLPERARAAAGRAHRSLAESPADQRTGGKGRRERCCWQTRRSLGPAAGDPRLTPRAV